MLGGDDKAVHTRVNSFNESVVTMMPNDQQLNTGGSYPFLNLNHLKTRKYSQGTLITNKLVSRQEQII